MAIAFDNENGSSSTSNVNNVTVSLTPGSGSDMILVAATSGGRGGLNYTETIYDKGGGDEATLTDYINDPGNQLSIISDLTDVDIVKSTSKSVTFTYNKTTPQTDHVVTFTGCDQTSRLHGTSTSNTTSVTQVTQDFTTTNGDACVDAVWWTSGGSAVSVGSGQTALTGSITDDHGGASYELSTGATTTMSWTAGGGHTWRHIGGILTQAAVAAAHPKMLLTGAGF